MYGNQNRIKCIDCEHKSSCFEVLSKKELELIDEFRVEVAFKKGEIICKQGSIASNIMYLKKGMAKIYFENNNKNLILRIIPAGSLFGLPSIGDNRFHYSARCYEDSVVCMIDIEVFRKYMNTNALFASEIVNVLNENTLMSYERIFCLTQNQLAGRMANILLCIHDRIFKDPVLDLPLSRKDLAELTNMSVESVTRILKEFKSDQLIELEGKKIRLLKIDKLRELCEIA